MRAMLKDHFAKRGVGFDRRGESSACRNREHPHVDRRTARGGTVSCASHTAYLTFNTKKRKEIIPITDDVERIIRDSGVQEGLALVSAMHLTASVIIQDEESGLARSIMDWAEQLAPENLAYHHHQTGEDNGDAHLKNLLLHHQVVLPITNGKIDFGLWQDTSPYDA